MKPRYDVFETLLKSRGLNAYRVSRDLKFTSVLFTDWKKGKSCPKSDKILKIADYFGVPVEYFYEGFPQISNDLKVALFGGNEEVTDDMWDEVYQFAQFVKARKRFEKENPPEGGDKK